MPPGAGRNRRVFNAHEHHRLQVRGDQAGAEFFFGDAGTHRQRAGDDGDGGIDFHARFDQRVLRPDGARHLRIFDDGFEAFVRIPDVGVVDHREVFGVGAAFDIVEPGAFDGGFEMAVDEDGDGVSTAAEFRAEADQRVGVAAAANGDEKELDMYSTPIFKNTKTRRHEGTKTQRKIG